MSVYVVRAFVKLRELLASNKDLARKLTALERSLVALDLKTQRQFKEIYEAIRALMTHPLPSAAPSALPPISKRPRRDGACHHQHTPVLGHRHLIRGVPTARLVVSSESSQMRVLKNILIGLGVLFLVVLAVFAWIGVSSSQFRKEQAPFVETFATDLSKRWDIADVYDRMANSFIQQASTPQARQLLRQFKQLGALKSVHDLELRSYNSNNTEQTGLFSFKGTFENGEAVVDVTITKKNGAVCVMSFYLKATRMRDAGSKLQTLNRRQHVAPMTPARTIA
jgi:hypothetical protein